jgi:hypothetical protein
LASWQTRLVKAVRDVTYELATGGTLVGIGKLIFENSCKRIAELMKIEEDGASMVGVG